MTERQQERDGDGADSGADAVPLNVPARGSSQRPCDLAPCERVLAVSVNGSSPLSAPGRDRPFREFRVRAALQFRAHVSCVPERQLRALRRGPDHARRRIHQRRSLHPSGWPRHSGPCALGIISMFGARWRPGRPHCPSSTRLSLLLRGTWPAVRRRVCLWMPWCSAWSGFDAPPSARKQAPVCVNRRRVSTGRGRHTLLVLAYPE